SALLFRAVGVVAGCVGFGQSGQGLRVVSVAALRDGDGNGGLRVALWRPAQAPLGAVRDHGAAVHKPVVLHRLSAPPLGGGRAGRLGPGSAVRLYGSEAEADLRPAGSSCDDAGLRRASSSAEPESRPQAASASRYSWRTRAATCAQSNSSAARR